jgi:hypothetical protein
MKAPSVREGSKENGTQVTGNRIYKGCLVRQLELADQPLLQSPIANAPGSGSGDGNLLCGVGVVHLYPYSLQSILFIQELRYILNQSDTCYHVVYYIWDA